LAYIVFTKNGFIKSHSTSWPFSEYYCQTDIFMLALTSSVVLLRTKLRHLCHLQVMRSQTPMVTVRYYIKYDACLVWTSNAEC